MPVIRITQFKIPDPTDVDKAIGAYKKLETDNKKDGKQYILALQAYKLYDDPRSQGYTLAAQSTFASLEDMKYYDQECEAHSQLKATVGPTVKGGPPLTIYTVLE